MQTCSDVMTITIVYFVCFWLCGCVYRCISCFFVIWFYSHPPDCFQTPLIEQYPQLSTELVHILGAIISGAQVSKSLVCLFCLVHMRIQVFVCPSTLHFTLTALSDVESQYDSSACNNCGLFPQIFFCRKIDRWVCNRPSCAILHI